MYHELGLDAKHPARQLPISGDYNIGKIWLGDSVTTVTQAHLEGFAQQVVRPIFPHRIPEHIWIVDQTNVEPGCYSSVDRLQVLLSLVARKVYKQTVVPRLTLLRLADKTQEDTYQAAPRIFKAEIIWTKLPEASTLDPPRGSPEFKVEQWVLPASGTAPIALARKKMTENPRFDKAVRQLVGPDVRYCE